MVRRRGFTLVARWNEGARPPCSSPESGRFACGFTLVELLVVMAIIATLLTIALPRYFGSVEKSKEVTLRQSLNVMRDAIDKFYADNGRYPEKLEDLVEKRYIRAVPLDPITESVETWILVPVPGAMAQGAVYDVKSGAKGSASDGKPFESL
jgi:general secretion pathway protein G